MTDKTEPSANSLTSVPAVVTFWLLGLWTLVVVFKFALVAWKVPLSADTEGFLGQVVDTTQNMMLMAVSFWVGSSVGAKASGDALARRGETDSAAIAQLAGAGPPPPAAPMSPELVVAPTDSTHPFMKEPVP